MIRLAAAIVALAGCASMIERRAAETTYRIAARAIEVSRRQSDIELAREAAPAGILQLEAFVDLYPAHAGFRALLAESVCQYASGFVFDDWEDASLRDRADEATRVAARLERLLDRCVETSLDVLPPAWREARASGSLIALLPSARARDVPALLAIANADTVRLALAPLAHLADVPSIRATLERCAALRPGSHDAQAELLLATLDAAMSALPGGTDGAAAFASARARAPEGTLLVDVLYARGTAVARGDRALFESTLHRVLDADLARWPQHRLANELARRRASRYLDVEARWFAL